MALAFNKLHPYFVAQASAVDLREVDDQPTLGQIRAALDQNAVLVFHNQSFSNNEQLAFAQRLDGKQATGVEPGAVALLEQAIGSLVRDGALPGAQGRRRRSSWAALS